MGCTHSLLVGGVFGRKIQGSTSCDDPALETGIGSLGARRISFMILLKSSIFCTIDHRNMVPQHANGYRAGNGYPRIKEIHRGSKSLGNIEYSIFLCRCKMPITLVHVLRST